MQYSLQFKVAELNTGSENPIVVAFVQQWLIFCCYEYDSQIVNYLLDYSGIFL